MRRPLIAPAVLVISALALTGCVNTQSNDGGSGSGVNSITIGTTDKVTSLDPAGAYDNGSFSISVNVNPFLLTIAPGGNELEGDIATSWEFVEPQVFEVKLKSDLKFANGHALTASDVKFSFDRMIAINDPDGPQSLLSNLESTVVVDDTTVQFNLKAANDQTFAQVLTTPAAPILDEEVYSATALTTADDIVAGNAFGGPYSITSYKENSLVTYEPNANYQGLHEVKNDKVSVSYLADETNLKQQVENGDIDVAYRSLNPTAVEDLSKNENLVVHEGPGGELRYVVFNTDTMPYGAKSSTPDEAKAIAVRQAIASVVDRDAISESVYKGTYAPAYSMVPDSMIGATTPYKQYGDGEGGPSVENATKILEEAGVTTPVALTIQYSPDHYGSSSADEYSALKDQLDSSGLFTVDLQSTAWTTYSGERISGYPIYQLGWFPDFSDADNYLSPFFLEGNFVQSWNSGLSAELISAVAASSVEPDQDARLTKLADAQQIVADSALALPLLSGKQIAVSGKDVQGVTLDASFKFFYSTLTKS